MIWLQTFAIFALVDALLVLPLPTGEARKQKNGKEQTQDSNRFHGAYGGYQMSLRQPYFARSDSMPSVSSFPYNLNSADVFPDKEPAVSSIVSLSSGPLCSGFHVRSNVVVTAASCVFRKQPEDLLVVSNAILNDTSQGSEAREYLSVLALNIHDKYKPSTDEHNIALLWVAEPNNIVPVLALPSMSSNHESQESSTFIVKFTYDEKKLNYYSKKVPAQVKVTLNECTNKSIPPNVFFCVSRLDSRPFSFGLNDLGTPLIYKTNDNLFLLGIFTGHKYYIDSPNYLYQDASSNIEFIQNSIESIDNPKE